MEDKTEKEFMQNNCMKCENKLSMLCYIVRKVNGTYDCANFIKKRSDR